MLILFLCLIYTISHFLKELKKRENTLTASSLRFWWENEFAILVFAAPNAVPAFSVRPPNAVDHPPKFLSVIYMVWYFEDRDDHSCLN